MDAQIGRQIEQHAKYLDVIIVTQPPETLDQIAVVLPRRTPS